MMFRKTKELCGFSILTRDGEIGHTDRFFFDDTLWVVRWIVVAVGRLLHRRLILLPPSRVSGLDPFGRKIVFDLHREQVENGPDIESHRPVWLQKKREIDRTMIPYWGAPGIMGYSMYPAVLEAMREAESGELDGEESRDDPHLRSSREVIGYHIGTGEGDAGCVDDFLVNDEDWRIGGLIVSARNQVLLPARFVDRIDWSRKKVWVELPRDSLDSLSPA
jgi:hypothetical protein